MVKDRTPVSSERWGRETASCAVRLAGADSAIRRNDQKRRYNKTYAPTSSVKSMSRPTTAKRHALTPATTSPYIAAASAVSSPDCAA